MYGADYKLPGMLYGKVLRSPHAHARIRSIDTSAAAKLPGVKAVITGKDLPDQKFDYIGPERVAVNFWHVTRNILAREKALYEGHAVAAVAAISASIAEEACALIKIDYEVLPHVIDVDEAMKPDAPLLFEDMITRGVEPAPTKPSNISKRLEFARRRRRGRVPAGRRGDREGVQDRRGAPGLYRAARLLRALRRRWPDGDLVVEPGPLPDARADRADPAEADRRHPRLSGRDRRRLRRQDGDLPGAGRDDAVDEVGQPGAPDDGARGRVPRHRSHLGFVDVGEDRRHQGRQDRRRRRHLQVPGRRVPRLAGDERLPVRVRPVRHSRTSARSATTW